jgi:hypothetical protein
MVNLSFFCCCHFLFVKKRTRIGACRATRSQHQHHYSCPYSLSLALSLSTYVQHAANISSNIPVPSTTATIKENFVWRGERKKEKKVSSTTQASERETYILVSKTEKSELDQQGKTQARERETCILQRIVTHSQTGNNLILSTIRGYAPVGSCIHVIWPH